MVADAWACWQQDKDKSKSKRKDKEKEKTKDEKLTDAQRQLLKQATPRALLMTRTFPCNPSLLMSTNPNWPKDSGLTISGVLLHAPG